MVEYSAVVVNHGVHPSESLIKRSGFLRGILLVASAILLKTARFRADYPAHAHLAAGFGLHGLYNSMGKR
jgi:hypothetical protein